MLRPMPLSTVEIRGYQSYRESQAIELDPQLTLIAGRNDVGKSALLRVLRLFTEPQVGPHEDFALVHRWSGLTTAQLLPLVGDHRGVILNLQNAEIHTLKVTYGWRASPRHE